MLILGLMWVASWFSGVPSVGSKLLDTPKFLTHVLCHSRVCQLTLTRSSSSETASFNLASSSLSTQSDDRPTESNWIHTIEQMLLTSTTPVEDTHHPVTEFLDSVQSLFSQLPIVTDAKESSSVAIVEVGFDETPLSQPDSWRSRLGFWQCPTESASSGHGFQIWVKGCEIATVRDRTSAQFLSEQFRQLLETPNLDASRLRVALDNGRPSLKLGDRTIFRVSDSLAARLGRPAELVAIKWMNNLRIALGQPSIPLADAQVELYQLAKTENNIDGMASWYGPYFHGRQTANGEIFDQNELTAAHPTLPLGTFLKVTNRLNGKSIVVRVNDRGPYFDNRVLDLSKRAANIINSEDRGVVPIEAVVMQSTVITQAKKPPQQVARLVTGY